MLPYMDLVQPPIDQLEDMFDQLMSGFFLTTSHLVIGVILGRISAHKMRCHHLRWTWAALALTFFLLARDLLAGSLAISATAALYAAVLGRHWHRQDVMAGGDLADIAAARRGPFVVLHVLSHKLRSRLAASPNRKTLRAGRMNIGCAVTGGPLSIPFGAADGGRHTLVVGATGSGKTVTETWIAAGAIDAGFSAVVIDPKGDAYMCEQLAHSARNAGCQFVHWTPDGPTAYNPFGQGSASEIADKALAGEHFSESHYQRQAQRYLGHVVRALHGAKATVSLSALVQALDPGQLELIARTLPEQQAQDTFQYLDSLSARQRADLGGVRDRLAILAESDIARWLDPQTPDASTFSLLGAIEQKAVVYFDLKVDATPLLARMLGGAIVQDLQSAMASLQRSPIATVVVIDEFAAIAAQQVAHLFGRARSAGMNILLGTQELSDLRQDTRRQLLEQVLGNLSALLVHRQVVPESADLIVKLAGSRGIWRTSRSSNDRWTRTRVSTAVLEADEIRRLGQGWVAAIEPGRGVAPQIGRVFH